MPVVRLVGSFRPSGSGVKAALMERVVDWLGPALEPWGYVLLGLATMLEASAFIGLVVPGEAALLFAGFLAQQGLKVWGAWSLNSFMQVRHAKEPRSGFPCVVVRVFLGV
jgi:hypothetical protein